MTRDQELWGFAASLLARLGNGARQHAAERLGLALRAGDEVGINLWRETASRLSRLVEAETLQ